VSTTERIPAEAPPSAGAPLDVAAHPGLIVGGYAFAMLVAEVLGVVVVTFATTVAYAAIAVIALHHHHFVTTPEEGLGRRRSAVAAFLRCVTIIALARIATFALPLHTVPAALWPAILSLPIGTGIAVVRAAREPSGWRDSWFTAAHAGREVVIAAAGIPLSFVAFVVVRPRELIANHSLPTTLIAVASLLLLAAVEETLYRGLLQRSCVALFSRSGVAVAAAIAGITTIGDGSVSSSLVATGMAAIFGAWVYRTRRLTGVTAAHAIVLIGMLIVWPRVLP
jgi:membrane protease YdiL (CAAX protease family)